ncbi:hypothetical protein EVAR_22193_1 [Eumeta japonica]|uniref:Uncharacterized protein n=1 Tax=Eumeta variegata TaxID=151549 RepID=A0A4C1UB61_EUMVA|nr:hypothetical protein EVAR_22193_1 [Eumeta japonica]
MRHGIHHKELVLVAPESLSDLICRGALADDMQKLPPIWSAKIFKEINSIFTPTISKTKVMMFVRNETTTEYDVCIGGERVEQANEFAYLVVCLQMMYPRRYGLSKSPPSTTAPSARLFAP